MKVEVKVSEAELRFSEIKGAGKHVSVATYIYGGGAPRDGPK